MSEKYLITYISPYFSEEDHSINDLLEKEFPIKIESLKSVNDVFSRISDSNYHTDAIVIDIDYLSNLDDVESYEIVNTLRTLLSCTVYRSGAGRPKKRTTKIMGWVSENSDPTLIKEMMKIFDRVCIRGRSKWGYLIVKDDISMLLNDENSVHKKITEVIQSRKKTGKVESDVKQIKLTPRQQQVFNLVSTRGSSNKAIAKLLKISESTVKLHMSVILKKYGVRNRTQLAVFSKDNN